MRRGLKPFWALRNGAVGPLGGGRPAPAQAGQGRPTHWTSAPAPAAASLPGGVHSLDEEGGLRKTISNAGGLFPRPEGAGPVPSGTARAFGRGPGLDALLSCTAGLQVVPLRRRGQAPSSLAIRSQASTWLLGCGEDAQRGVLAVPAPSAARVERLLLPSLRAADVLGVPGMLCSIGTARQQGHIWADFPVHVYGPSGTVRLLECVPGWLPLMALVHGGGEGVVGAEEGDGRGGG